MIVYKDVLNKLKAAGYSSYRIRQENVLSEQTLTNIRHNKPITTKSLDIICSLTELPVSEIIEYRKEKE